VCAVEDLTHTSFRKLSHLAICLKENIEANSSNFLKDFRLVPRAICDLDLDEIDTSTTIFGKHLAMPLMAAAMTGGHPEVRPINEIIAQVAQKSCIAMGVGSQRAALEKKIPYISESFQIVRELAPNILLIGNLGAAQFGKEWCFGKQEVQEAIDLIQADALAVHVNPAQELTQIEGDTCFHGFFDRVTEIAGQVKTPVLLKEVGSGMSREDASRVQGSHLAGIDVGGLGGTSWVAVEALRALEKQDRLHHEFGRTFWDWGIPTALSVVETRSVMDKVIIATGGVRNGLEAAQLLALGADCVGMALPFLKAAHQGMNEVEFLVQKFQLELKAAMLLTGCRTIADLRKIPIVVTGIGREWLLARGIDMTMPWRAKK